jgi:hypothetical protein
MGNERGAGRLLLGLVELDLFPVVFVEALHEHLVGRVLSGVELRLLKKPDQAFLVVLRSLPEPLEPLSQLVRRISLLVDTVQLGVRGEPGGGEVRGTHDPHPVEHVSLCVEEAFGEEPHLHLLLPQELDEFPRELRVLCAELRAGEIGPESSRVQFAVRHAPRLFREK